MGLGDDLMTTGVVKRLARENPDAQIVIGDGTKEFWSPLFDNNPKITRLSDLVQDRETIWIKHYPSCRPYFDPEQSTRERYVYTDFRAEPGEIFFTPQELDLADKLIEDVESFVVVEPHVKVGPFKKNKDWGFERWQEVVRELKNDFFLLQMGPEEAKTLEGVHRVVTDGFRVACAVLRKAKGLIGPEGALCHAAAAFSRPAVVVFGGVISPETTGYPTHVNFFIDEAPSPCGSLILCDHCRDCLDRIKPAEVVQAARETFSAAART